MVHVSLGRARVGNRNFCESRERSLKPRILSHGVFSSLVFQVKGS